MQFGKHRITPFLWFNDQAEEAAEFYISVFDNSRIIDVTHYTEGVAAMAGRPAGSVMTVTFELDSLELVAMNGGPDFHLTEAFSLMVQCDSQQEVDYYWDRLSEGGDVAAQQCGWLKDRFGLSWQIVPRKLGELADGADPERADRVMKALCQMKKLDLTALERAAEA